MLGRSPLSAFLATANPKKARACYSKTLGLRLDSDDRFALVFDCAGVPLRIQAAKMARRR